MSTLGIRPRFRQIVAASPQKVQQQIEEALAQDDAPCQGVIIPGHITLKFPNEEQHFWTPQLNLTIEEEEDNQTLIRGFYGPRPSVWSIFTMGYAAIAILSTFVLVYGMSQWMLKKDPVVLWGLLVLGILGLTLYLTAQLGQKFGAQQMFTLHHFYENSIHSKVKL